MLFNQIKPFVRYVRRLEITTNSCFSKSYPLDCRLFYVISGCGEIEIDDLVYTLPTGSILYINSGVVYKILSVDVTYLAINFDFTNKNSNQETPIPPAKANDINEHKTIEHCIFDDTTYFNEFCYLKDAIIFKKDLEKTENEYTNKLPFYRQKCSNLLEEILIAIARKNEKRAIKEDGFNIEEIINYIQLNVDKNITNFTLSEIFHFHPNYISQEFKRNIGKPLHQFVLETKILFAISLMESGNNNITEISKLCGFNDTNYFTRYFKKITGIPPGKYIKYYTEIN